MRASTRIEERVRELETEVDRLKREVVRHRERRIEAEDRRARAVAEATSWRGKIRALAENYRRRIRHLTAWSERLGRERVVREDEIRDLTEQVERFQAERDRMRRSLVRFQSEALSLFLGGALEEAPSGESVRRLSQGGESERRILSLLTSRSEPARTGS